MKEETLDIKDDEWTCIYVTKILILLILNP